MHIDTYTHIFIIHLSFTMTNLLSNKGDRKTNGNWSNPEWVRNYAREGYDRVKRQRLASIDVSIMRECTTCHEEKPIAEFGVRRAQCYGCQQIQIDIQRSTLTGFLKKMLCDMKNTASNRAKRGRSDAGECTITLDELMDIYTKQDGYCYYFKTKKMSHVPNSQWMMSPERLNNIKGYTQENLVLCCFEFNTKAQWSLSSINEIIQLRSQAVDLDQFRRDATIKVVRRHLTAKKSLDGTMLQCQFNCGQWKLKDQFLSTRQTCCSICDKLQDTERSNTVLGFIKNLYSDARGHSKARSKKNSVKGQCTITMEKVIDMIIQQSGKCYYSGIPLVFKQKTKWQCSLERFKVEHGYIDDNWCLICLEFNSTSRVSQIIGAQWTKDKFDNEFLPYLEFLSAQ